MLFNFLAEKHPQPKRKEVTSQEIQASAENIFAEIVEAVGLTKLDIEVFGTKLMNTHYNQRHTEQHSVDDESELAPAYLPKAGVLGPDSM